MNTSWAKEEKAKENELVFEISEEETIWVLERQQGGRGSIKPSCVAILYIKGDQSFPDFTKISWTDSMSATPAGKMLSEKQIDFLAQGEGVRKLNSSEGDIKGAHYFRLYAVSEKDARLTARAFIEALSQKVEEKLKPSRERREQLQSEIVEFESAIATNEEEVRAISPRLTESKRAGHFLSAAEAEQTALEMNKQINSLDVEIVGINTRITMIQKLKSENKLSDKEILTKLELMLVEQDIELAAALACKNTATNIRDKAQEYFNIHERFSKLERNIKNSTSSVQSRKSDLSSLEEWLSNPADVNMPPKVYKNKVTIYPMKTN